ncbi:hypothetical protein BDY24DRAFT_414847 [Mrakia frigida]|uniref:wax synthase family protein n=1 Tax=Mrakia frigida TaxID=29902 RepID=UPI003FCC0E67
MQQPLALLIPRLAFPSEPYTHSNPSLVSSTTLDLLINPSLSLWNNPPRPPLKSAQPCKSAKGHALAYVRDSLAMTVICLGGYDVWGMFERKELGNVAEGGVTLVFGFCVYLFVELVWHGNAAIFVGLLGWDRTTMSEIFDRPWKSTSVHDFWARRWHPLLSPTFGFYSSFLPSSLQPPFIFFLSGLIHDLGLLPLTPDLAPSLITLFFTAQLVGIAAEVGWKKLTGRRVEGWWGFVWVWVWFGWTGRWVLRGWADKGVVRLAVQSVFFWLRD